MLTMVDSKYIVSMLLLVLMVTTTMSESSTTCNGTYCGWIKVSGSYPDVMPRGLRCMAIGYDIATDTVLLIGGYNYPEQLTTFSGTKFSDQGLGFLVDYGTYGIGQFYTQIDNRLYMIAYRGSAITYVDTKTRTYNNWPYIYIPINVGYQEGCLASMKTNYHEYLFVVGGLGDNKYIINSLQIYNMTSDEWISSAPSMDTTRMDVSCLVKNDMLFAIGGYGSTDSSQLNRCLDSIEILDVGNGGLMNIQNRDWKYMQGRLSIGADSFRAVGYGDYIIVIGGGTQYSYAVKDINVHVIDTISLSVKLDGSIAQMDKGLECPGVIILKDVLYIFGGDDSLFGGGNPSSVDSYLYLDLGPSLAPTNAPTNVSNETAEGSDMVLMISLIAIGLFILLLIVCGAYRYSMKYVKKRNIDLQSVHKSKLLYPL
eukprot:135862_1